MPRKPTSYWDYVKVEPLLSLQSGIAESERELSNDEVLFIIVHQIDELWFKLALRELVSVRNLFAQPRVPEQSLSSAARGIHRMAILFHKIADHFAVIETMTTRDYLSFRDKLSPASGFQSPQLREIEILLGLGDDARIPLGHEKSYLQALRHADGTPSFASERVEERLSDRPTLLEAIQAWLFRTPIQGSTPDDPHDAEAVRAFIDAYGEAQTREVQRAKELAIHDALTPDDAKRLDQRYDREIASARSFLLAEDVPEGERAFRSRIRAALVFIESYRELPLLAWPREVIDGIIELEQAMLVFRQRHARMVERVIGRRTGTGGSSGVDYLDRTALEYRVFRDLWAVRTILIRREAAPALMHAEKYNLAPGD